MNIIIVAAVLAAVCFFLSRAYRGGWSRHLTAGLRFDGEGVFEGERGEVVETLANRKLLPVFWGRLGFKVPHELSFDGSALDHDYYREDSVSAFSYEEITRRLKFTAERRGFYRLRDAQLVGGDLLFSYRMIHRFDSGCEIYVYPRVKNPGRFTLDFKKLVGDTVARHFFLEDPFFFRGIRDYRPFDSLKAVNWKATARTGGLKVNEYSSTQSQRVTLLLDLDGYNRFDGEAIKEDVIRVGAMIAERCLKNGIAVGLVSNAADAVTGISARTECKSGRSHYYHLLRTLARLDTSKLSTPFCEMLEPLRRRQRDLEYILVSYHYGEELARKVSSLEASGLSIQWVLLHDKSRRPDFAARSDLYVCEVEY